MKMRAIAVLAALALFSMISPPSVFATWTENGSPVTTAVDYQYEPKMVSDGAGGTIVCWADWRTAVYLDIYAQRLDAAGNPLWGSLDVPICTASNDQVNPAIISDGEGGAIIVWQDYRAADNDIYAQRVNAAGHIQWTSDGVPVCTATANQRGPQLIPDGAGGAIIAWHDWRNVSDADIYAQRIDGGGVVQWIADGSFVIWLSGDQNNFSMVTDGAGGAVISWLDTRSGLPPHIYAQRIDDMGLTQWSSMGTPICTGNGYCDNLVSIPDGSGGAFIVWNDDRAGTHDIYAQHLLFNSMVEWTTDGVPVSIADEDQTTPSIVPDGSGGFFTAWQDYRSGTSYDIYLQRMDSGGNRLWDPDAVPICTYVHSQASPFLVQDGVGGVFVVWSDWRNGVDSDIYSQRVDASGAAQWMPGGTEICVYSGGQGEVSAIPGENGGVLISWEDARDDSDIYANYLDDQGRAGYMPAVIHSVEDVPYDQGGAVNLAWNASAYDYAGHEISHYSIWRALDTPAAQMMIQEGAMALEDLDDIHVDENAPVLRLSLLGGMAYYWELIGTTTAYYLEGYSMTAPTAYDSTALGHNYQYFQVIAHSASPSTFYVSEPDSGYSVDNLAPETPLELAGERKYTPEGIQLTWDDNVELDLLEYRVYRGTTSNFVPDSGNMIASPSESEYFDDSWSWEQGYFYKVSAVDIHGNESGYALLEPDQLTGDDPLEMPAATFLAQNFPNPFNPVTNIGFGIKETGYVSLRIYDAAGRLITTLVEESRPAGRYTCEWSGQNSDGSPAASGVYFYRLISKDFEETKKMILLR